MNFGEKRRKSKERKEWDIPRRFDRKGIGQITGKLRGRSKSISQKKMKNLKTFSKLIHNPDIEMET